MHCGILAAEHLQKIISNQILINPIFGAVQRVKNITSSDWSKTERFFSNFFTINRAALQQSLPLALYNGCSNLQPRKKASTSWRPVQVISAHSLSAKRW